MDELVTRFRPGDSAGGARYALARALGAHGCDSAELDARVLVTAMADMTLERLVAEPDRALTAGQAERLGDALTRRLAGEPVARIVGEKEFWGRAFRLGADTLVPRPDSELLVEAALAHLSQAGPAAPRIADPGTGSGCLLISLLAEWPGATGVGTDISAAALATARANAARHGVAARARFAEADWLDGVAGRFDLIVANPPYIPSGEIAGLAPEVARYDPRRALDGGADGLDAVRRLAAAVPERLARGGIVLMEVGKGQAGEAAQLLRGAGLTVDGRDDLLPDLAGVRRVVRARSAS